jgi:hypothetical protein
MVAFNRNAGIHSKADILDALRLMYDSIDFGPKLFNCYDIACAAVMDKIDNFISIIKNSVGILPEPIKNKILEKYGLLKEQIIIMNDEFFKIVVKKLEDDITTKQKKQSLGDRGQQRALAESEDPLPPLEARKRELESDLLAYNLKEQERQTKLIELAAAKEKAERERIAAEAAKEKAERERIAAIATASSAPKKDKGFFSKLADAAKAVFTSKNNELKDKAAEEKDKKTTISTLEAQGKKIARDISDKLKELQKVLEKTQKVVLLNLSKVHVKDDENAKQFLEQVQQKWEEFKRSKGRVLGKSAGGNKPNKSRQNKQQYQKRYTKRRNKKTYRKRTQKHLKIKRRRYTKRRK